jgi:hypothetical protein
VPHYDDETIALLALVEAHAANDNAYHLSTCAQCRDSVDELRAVVSVGRELESSDTTVAPPPMVWSRIVDELALVGGDAQQASDMPQTSPVVGVAPIDSRPSGVPEAQVVSLESKRRQSPMSRLFSLGVAAAVGLVLGAGGMWALGRSPSQVQPVQPVQLASASLAALDIPDTNGTAVLQVKSANQRALTVNVSNLPLEAGKFYEVWLMDPLDKNLVALGVLGVDGHGAYVVPAGLDLTQYTAVDVSLQPFNGSPLHSSVSAVRGIMKA